ncbi:hypothetical protein MMC11_003409 [Xylographa trunciseda]|nr:hypothetical protein [Xylographa trunciseda]
MTSPPTSPTNPPSDLPSPPIPPGTPLPLLLLKTRNTPSDAYATYFSSAPRPTPLLQPLFIPVLQHAFRPTALSHLRALLALPAPAFPYGGLICTSQRAVEALGHALASFATSDDAHDQAAPRPDPALALPLYTVGPATARALAALQARHLPRCAVRGRDTGNGARLAAYILADYSPAPLSPSATNNVPPPATGLVTTNAVGAEAARAPLLFLVGEARRDVIPASLAAGSVAAGRRVRVDELVVYETGVVEGFGAALERGLGSWAGGDGARARRRGPVWVAVFSPAGCAEMVKVLRGRRGGERRDGPEGLKAEEEEEEEKRRDVFVASIGPTTRDYLLDEFDFRVDVCAERPSPEGLAEGIAQFMKEQGFCP